MKANKTTLALALVFTFAAITPPPPSLTATHLPPGTIILWHGDCNRPPPGWLLCDGQNNTPNMQGRFVIGAGPLHPAGSSGGRPLAALDLTLTTHTHTHQVVSGEGDSPAGQTRRTDDTGPYPVTAAHTHGPGDYATGTDTHTHAISGSIDASPPYYALCFLMRP